MAGFKRKTRQVASGSQENERRVGPVPTGRVEESPLIRPVGTGPTAQRRSGNGPIRLMISAAVLCLVGLFSTSPALAFERLDEMTLDRWKKLREVERYQLNIAEKYYRDKNWKVAMSEYEKFLSLYETSEGAPYSQMKWSLCLIELKRHNTAIKDGFQSVIDYWPESPEAITSGYFIGRAWKEIGELSKAKKAFDEVLRKHPQHTAAVYSAVDLIDISTVEDDIKTRIELWKRLTFDTKRNRETKNHCVSASQQLATHLMLSGEFAASVTALETTYSENDLATQVTQFIRRPLSQLTADEKTRPQGHKLADDAVAWLRKTIPVDRSDQSAKAAARNYWFHMAAIHAAAKQQDQVAEIFKSIESKFGIDDSTLQRMGDWYKSIDRYDDARKQYARFENKIQGQNQIAYSYRQQRKYEPAVLAYGKNVAADADNAVKWHSEIAHTWREARKWSQAIAVYEELLALDKENPDRWRWEMALTYRDAGKYKEAIGHFRQCNNFPSNYGEMAACHRALKDYKEAVILYNQIIGGAPKSAPWATLQIGYTHEQAGNKESAIKSFQQVCRTWPKDSHASRAHAHLQTKYKITVTLGGAKDD